MVAQKIGTIAFQGLDGSGKGTTIAELSKLIDCICWETPEETKEYRGKKIKELGETDELNEFMIESYLQEWSEIQRLRKDMDSEKVVLIDRCWVSFSSVRFAELEEYPEWPKEEFRPDIVFTIRVDEKLRCERILKRAGGIENLKDRERRLIEDDNFRNDILNAELELGCKPLRIREKNPEVVALRALQFLLGEKDYEHRRRET